MTTFQARIAVVGGGLAGLVAAWRLVQQGVRDIVLLEARTNLGGRILSVDATGSLVDMTDSALDRFDLGPSVRRAGHRLRTAQSAGPPAR